MIKYAEQGVAERALDAVEHIGANVLEVQVLRWKGECLRRDDGNSNICKGWREQTVTL